MDPITVGIVGTAVAGAGAQWLNSQEAQKASAAERKKMQALINKLEEPSFDTSKLTPEDYQVVNQFIPEVAADFEEIAPTTIKGKSEAATAGLGAQLSALEKLRNLSDSGDDTQSRLLRSQALRDAAIQSQGEQEAIRQRMARMGQTGSTNDLITSLLAQQGQSQNAALTSQNAAMDAYNRKLEAMRGAADLGGNIRGTELTMEGNNADIINAYNQRFANARNDYNQYASGLRNDAQLRNLNNAQDISNKNVAQRNDYMQYNQKNANDLAQQAYANSASKLGMNVNQGQGRISDVNQSAQGRAGAISGLQQGVNTGLIYSGKKKDQEEEFR